MAERGSTEGVVLGSPRAKAKVGVMWRLNNDPHGLQGHQLVGTQSVRAFVRHVNRTCCSFPPPGAEQSESIFFRSISRIPSSSAVYIDLKFL